MLKIEIEKRKDGQGLLRCTRADGSVAWQKQGDRTAAHFALHDLTHYSVETQLGYRRGFFGLVAAGWEFEETQGKSARGPLPDEALEVERIVGLFDTERASGALWSTEEFNTYAPRPLCEEDIQRVRRKRGELFAAWRETEPGQVLVLSYP